MERLGTMGTEGPTGDHFLAGFADPSADNEIADLGGDDFKAASPDRHPGIQTGV
jgi:hypothetical protein